MTSALIILPSIACALLLVYGIILAFLLRSRRLQSGGFGWLERRWMRRRGTRAHARVLDSCCDTEAWTSLATESYQVVLEVRREGETEGERVQMILRWNWEKWDPVVPGMEFPVLVSSRFPGRVMPDYVALRSERLDAKQKQHMAVEERQRALLDQGHQNHR